MNIVFRGTDGDREGYLLIGSNLQIYIVSETMYF